LNTRVWRQPSTAPHRGGLRTFVLFQPSCGVETLRRFILDPTLPITEAQADAPSISPDDQTSDRRRVFQNEPHIIIRAETGWSAEACAIDGDINNAAGCLNLFGPQICGPVRPQPPTHGLGRAP